MKIFIHSSFMLPTRFPHSPLRSPTKSGALGETKKKLKGHGPEYTQYTRLYTYKMMYFRLPPSDSTNRHSPLPAASVQAEWRGGPVPRTQRTFWIRPCTVRVWRRLGRRGCFISVHSDEVIWKDLSFGKDGRCCVGLLVVLERVFVLGWRYVVDRRLKSSY